MPNHAFQVLFDWLGGSPIQGLGIVLLAVSGLAYVGGRIFRAESDVQRRMQTTPTSGRAESKSAHSRVNTALASLGSRVADPDGADAKVLRGKLVQAGFYAQQA
ncbi:MAG TPA: hypothetical protein VMU56_09070, partial [Beijerinckiaceae bacterium]|nr:hypothetical protein [Beijerinckiaceae bacterium]